MYLNLVARGYSEIGKIFQILCPFSMYIPLAQQFFADHHQIQESFYEHDLVRLQAVTLPQHMKGCDLVENFRKNKYVIHLCTESYHTLKSHLQVVVSYDILSYY